MRRKLDKKGRARACNIWDVAAADLGIDYDGSQTRLSESSVNYPLQVRYLRTTSLNHIQN
jgi:arginine decarboxylase-like protein